MGRKAFHTHEIIDAVLAAWREGGSYIAIGKRFDMSKNTVAGIVSRNKQLGEIAKRAFRPQGWRRAPEGRPQRPAGQKMTEADPHERWNCHSPAQRREPRPLGRAATHTRKMEPVARYDLCQWIAGDPKGRAADDSCKCGAETGDTKLYCPQHEKRAWFKQEPAEAVA